MTSCLADGAHLTAPFAALLEPGTRLRLDDWVGIGFCDGQVHSTITWRFAVLDGPLAGYCLEADITYWDDHATYRRDPVEPVAGWSHDWQRHPDRSGRDLDVPPNDPGTVQGVRL